MQKFGRLFSNYAAKDEVENSCDVAKSQNIENIVFYIY